MKSSDKVPQFFVNFIGTLYRSIVWAFGKDLPRPLGSRNFCPYFLAVFFTFFIPIGLLPVSIGWMLRLTLGKDRGGAIARALKKPLEILVVAVFVLVCIAFLMLIGWLAYESGIAKSLLFLLWVVAYAAAYVVAASAIFLSISFVAKRIPRVVKIISHKLKNACVGLNDALSERPESHFTTKSLKNIGRLVFFVFVFFFRVIFSFFYAFWWAARQGWGLTYKGYKNSCPIVAFP